MTAYEIMKARHALEVKKRDLRAIIEDADEAMCSAYQNYCTAEADTDSFSDEEVEKLCYIYEARCATFNELEEEMEVIEHAIEVFSDMESVVDELYRYKIWEG